MSDREWLELAAKAAGVFLTREQFERECTSPWDDEMEPHYDEADGAMHGWRTWYGGDGEIGGWEGFDWNPLDDDGDAFRLAADLGINTVQIRYVEDPRFACRARQLRVSVEESAPDPRTATRRAIVRAAAEIGRQHD